MNFTEIARRAAKLAADNSPTILTSLGVVGAVSSVYLAGKASFQAADIIRLKEAADEERGIIVPDPKQLIKQRVELCWRLYIPAATTLGFTLAAIIGANHIGSRQAAGLAAAYTITEKSFDEYKAKVVEKLGERKETAIHDEIAQDRVHEAYLDDDIKLIGLDNGELCYDMFSDRYFKNTVEGIRSAENDLNKALIHNGYASLSEFYAFLGLPSPAFSENIGWNSDKFLELRITSVLAHGEKPCIVVGFRDEPLPDYGRFH